MKKITIILTALILLAAAFVTLKIFVIGEEADTDSLAVHVEESNGQLTIYIQATDSATALSDLKFHYEDTVLYLTIQKVLPSPLYNSGEKCLYYEITGESEVWLNNKQIWIKPK